jgi:hypothetical protein
VATAFARAIAVDKNHVSNARPQGKRHGGRGTDRANTNDRDFHGSARENRERLLFESADSPDALPRMATPGQTLMPFMTTSSALPQQTPTAKQVFPQVYIGGIKPFLPTLIWLAVNEPSAAVIGKKITCAPGCNSAMVPGA